jgi:hypothetical protein
VGGDLCGQALRVPRQRPCGSSLANLDLTPLSPAPQQLIRLGARRIRHRGARRACGPVPRGGCPTQRAAAPASPCAWKPRLPSWKSACAVRPAPPPAANASPPAPAGLPPAAPAACRWHRPPHRPRRYRFRRRSASGAEPLAASTTFSASMKRASSPPDAIFIRGARGVPGLVATMNSTRSTPWPRAAPHRNATCVSKRAFSSLSAGSSAITCLSSALAALRRLRPTACPQPPQGFTRASACAFSSTASPPPSVSACISFQSVPARARSSTVHDTSAPPPAAQRAAPRIVPVPRIEVEGARASRNGTVRLRNIPPAAGPAWQQTDRAVHARRVLAPFQLAQCRIDLGLRRAITRQRLFGLVNAPVLFRRIIICRASASCCSSFGSGSSAQFFRNGMFEIVALGFSLGHQRAVFFQRRSGALAVRPQAETSFTCACSPPKASSSRRWAETSTSARSACWPWISASAAPPAATGSGSRAGR